MIPVKRVRKPSGYDTKVKTPGDAWLKDHPEAQRPPALWSPYTTTLAAGFDKLCGYAAMHDPTGGTVDHFLSYKNHPHLTYEWSNFRFASATLNSSKKTADDTVLDPHEVGEGWFEILLPSLQMRLTDKVPLAQRAKAEFTLKRLKLRDGERILRWRQSWFALYEQGELTLDGLRQMAPLIAAAVEARDRI
jgi:5-methylcytosine-specific restriction endonuclease McrA